MEFGKPRQALTGIVVAGEDGVWNALLETSPYLTPRMREMIAGSRGMLRFPARQAEGDAEASPVPGVNVEADGSLHTLAISGQWWFCGRRPQFERALTAIGSLLGCPARIAG
jgi:hypothetical protein